MSLSSWLGTESHLSFPSQGEGGGVWEEKLREQ